MLILPFLGHRQGQGVAVKSSGWCDRNGRVAERWSPFRVGRHRFQAQDTRQATYADGATRETGDRCLPAQTAVQAIVIVIDQVLVEGGL